MLPSSLSVFVDRMNKYPVRTVPSISNLSHIDFRSVFMVKMAVYTLQL